MLVDGEFRIAWLTFTTNSRLVNTHDNTYRTATGALVETVSFMY